jgi:hypothetical protein
MPCGDLQNTLQRQPVAVRIQGRPVSGRSGRVSLKINHMCQTRTVEGGSLQSLQENRRRPAAPRRAGRSGDGVLQLRDICQTPVILLGHGDHDRLPAYR